MSLLLKSLKKMFPPYENVYLGLDELMTSIVLAKGVYPYAYFTGPIDFSSRNISETISPKHYQQGRIQELSKGGAGWRAR